MVFLIDVNLPQKFSFFHSNEFTHVVDIDPKMKDGAIWEYAKAHKMTILTKDSDFFHKSMLDDAGPGVVYFKLGNTTLSELHAYFSSYWLLILDNLPNSRIITAYPDKIEVIR